MAAPLDVDSGLDDDSIDWESVFGPLRDHWLALVLMALLFGGIASGSSFLLAPRYESSTTFLPPQQQQSGAASALAALGPLAALAGVGSGGGRASGDQYASLMRSVTVSDRIIDRFDLVKEYDSEFRVDARRTLDKRVRIAVNKKDGLVTVEVEDTSPKRAADMANQYVEELRLMTSTLAITEAQQRRSFFQRQLEETRAQLQKAQLALEGSGFNAGALKSEPKAAAESYAKIKAEVAATEIRLQTTRARFAEATPEVQQLASMLAGLRAQLARAEQPVSRDAGPDYVGKYRDFKYQEALFEVYARQFELARVDESREGALIQVVDPAQPAEKKSKPERVFWFAGGAGVGLLLGAVWAYRRSWHSARAGNRVPT